MKHFDCVVIGSGNGGLGACCKMLNEGKSTLLVEKHNLPGGFATSFVRGRFEFEASLHEFNGIGIGEKTGQTGILYKEIGVYDKIEWLEIENAYHLYSKEEGIDFIMPVGIEKCIEACKNLCEDGEKYAKQFLDLCKEIYEAMAYVSKMHGKPDIEVLKTQYIDYLTMGSYSVNEVYDAMNMPHVLRCVFSAYWCYLGSHCDELSFVHYANMIYKYLSEGAVVPKHRSHEIASAFIDRIYELGGEVYFNTEATNILTDENNEVCGVKLSNGEVIETRHVIANVSPHIVYSKMLDKEAVPERALKLCNFRKFSGRGFTLFLGLNKSPDELGIMDHSYFIFDTSDNVKLYENMKTFEKNNGQATVCLNRVNPDCSPKGTTILYFTTLYNDDIWKDIKEEDYYKFKNEIALKLINAFEEATKTHIKEYIEEIEVATPWTYARYTGNPEGCIYGYDSLYDDGLMGRILMTGEDHFVKGLRMCGAYAERLLGYPSSFRSGINEANRTLKDMEGD